MSLKLANKYFTQSANTKTHSKAENSLTMEALVFGIFADESAPRCLSRRIAAVGTWSIQLIKAAAASKDVTSDRRKRPNNENKQ